MHSCTAKSGLVTGASGGLGRATVLALAAHGANVVALSRNADKLQETAQMAQDLQGTVIAVQADVTDEPSVVDALTQVETSFGTLDFVVNNAGRQIERSFLETTNEDWDITDSTEAMLTMLPPRPCRSIAAAAYLHTQKGPRTFVTSMMSQSSLVVSRKLRSI